MINWGKVKFEAESLTEMCRLMPGREVRESAKENLKLDFNTSGLHHKKKIKCPPSRLLKEIKRNEKSIEKTPRYRRLSVPKLEILVESPRTVRPSQQTPRARMFPVTPKPRLSDIVPSYEPVQQVRRISIFNPVKVQSPPKITEVTVTPPNHMVSIFQFRSPHETGNPEIGNKTCREGLKLLSDARSIESLQMHTTKSIFEDTAPDCVRM